MPNKPSKKFGAKHFFEERLEGALLKLINTEYNKSVQISDVVFEDVDTYISLFDGNREERDYDWMSDVSIPEFPSHVLTQISLDVAQYFQTRDFVEVYIEDPSQEAIDAADATRELINRTLNQPHLFHFQKFIRSKIFNHLIGHVWAECWWEQETVEGVIGTRRRIEELNVDEYGNAIVDRNIQTPAMRVIEEEITGKRPLIDRFNYEILDPRNVSTDGRYTYSAQDKSFIYIRSEKTLDGLKKEASRAGYFNLDLLENLYPSGTKTSEETSEEETIDEIQRKYFDIIKRYGKFWAVVKERDINGYPLKVVPGIDDNGDILEDAELIEMIIIYAICSGSKILIAFHPTPYIDSDGIPYKPLIRGLCYIHPTKDRGVSDAKYAKPLQIAIDDTLNVSNDRVMLATLPTYKVKKWVAEDNPSLYIEPEHPIEVNSMDDIEELKIEENINGAMTQIRLLTDKMQQMDAIYPTTMGNLPAESSTTATAVAGAERRTNIRTNYKSLTFENTFLIQLYWMISQMTWAFAYPETGERLMGRDKVINFDPTRNYTYKPLSQSIETEESRRQKVIRWDSILGRIVQLQHPDTPIIVNYILDKICKLMGDEEANFSNIFLNPAIAMMRRGAVPEGAQEMRQSNQFALPMSSAEESTRAMAGGY